MRRSRLVPEQFVERFAQRAADGQAEADGRVVVALFDGVYRLARDADGVRQLLPGWKHVLHTGKSGQLADARTDWDGPDVTAVPTEQTEPENAEASSSEP